ncbi:MAG: Xaa-Pro peptidase family protein [Desulfomonilaceae bacterium]|jgi:Xaa-Pro aminopeptidase
MISRDPIALIREKLSKNDLDAALLNTSEITRSVNLRYLSGFSGSDATILITSDQLRLFTDGRYKVQSRDECENFRIHVSRDKIASIGKVIRSLGIKRLGIEGSRVSYDFMNFLQKKITEVEIVSLGRQGLESLRIIKDPTEVEAIRKAAGIASAACLKLLDSRVSGKSEIELAGRLELNFTELGASGESFSTIVASGPRSALPHGRPTGKKVEPNELVIIDYGCMVSGYCSDETVTCIVGSPDPEQLKIYQVVSDAHDKAIDCLSPGMRANQVDLVARQTISDAGWGKYFLHSLGHGIGLEVHEAPFLSPKSNVVLEEGMVFTIEPGVYIQGLGGVRLESLVHMSSSGPEVLSKAPKTLIHVD